METYKKNPLRAFALVSLSKKLKKTRQACMNKENIAWSYGKEMYPLIIRRLLTGLSIEEAVVVLEPLEKKEEKEIVAEGDLQCKKCQSRRIHRVEKQTRSADEAATVFCFCSECGNRWKF